MALKKPAKSLRQKDFREAKITVYRLFRFRPRSQKEIREKLILKNFPESIIEKTIIYFKSILLIDDELFAKAWIQSRLAKPYGMRRIQAELKLKGIDSDTIAKQFKDANANISENQIINKLTDIVKNRYKTTPVLKAKQRAFNYLRNRGFETGIIIKTLSKIY